MKIPDLKHNTVPQNDHETQIHESKYQNEDEDGQDIEKNENDKNNNINKQLIDDTENFREDDSNETFKYKLNLNLVSTERLEKVKNIGTNNDKNKVNQNSNIEIEENKNKFRSETK